MIRDLMENCEKRVYVRRLYVLCATICDVFICRLYILVLVHSKSEKKTFHYSQIEKPNSIQLKNINVPKVKKLHS